MSTVITSPANPNDESSDPLLPSENNADDSVQSENVEPTGPVIEDVPPPAPPNRYFLPSAFYRIVWSARRIFEALATRLAIYVHAGVAVEIAFIGKDRGELREVTPSAFRSRVEAIGELWKEGTDNRGRRISRPSRCSEDTAKALLDTREATELLPTITTVSASPVLTVDADGKPRILPFGYHKDLGGLFVTKGAVVRDIPLKDAIEALLKLLKDFKFQTPADKARAIAALISPAIVYGQLLGEARVPMFLVDANKSQAGKGYLLEIVAAIYGERPKIVVPRKGGVGSFDEDFNAALLRGCPFIMLDNLRGTLDSPHIESFLTAGGTFMARTFRRAPADIDPRHYIVFATSNRFETTPDMENRTLRISIYKRRQEHVFPKDLLADIRARQSFYLGCVFSVVSEWIAQGRQRTDEYRHSFRDWAQALDWIIVNLFKDQVDGRLMDYDLTSQSDKTDLAATLGFKKPDPAAPSSQN